MKKGNLLIVFTALLCFFSVKKAEAQITGVDLDPSYYFLDSVDRTCVPAALTYYYGGTVTGTFSSSDSLDAFFDYGDGTSATYKIGISSAKTFNVWRGPWGTHVYTTAGTYTTKVKVTSSTGFSDSLSSAPFTLTSPCVSSTTLSGDWADSTPRCSLPYGYYMWVNGSVTGSVSAYDTATIKVNFGDGTDTTIKAKISASGYYYASIYTHKYTITGTFSPVVTVEVTGGAKDTLVMPTFTLSTSCATVSGKLYLDDDKDCVIDAGEKGISYLPIKIENTVTGTTYYGSTWSDASGNYSVGLPAGTYTITPMVSGTSAGWYYPVTSMSPTCPSSGSVTLTVASSSTYTRDFAYECKTVDTLESMVTANSSCFIIGDTASLNLWVGSYWYYYHFLCMSLPTTLTVTLDPDLSYVSMISGAAPTSVVGKVLTFNLTGSDIASFSRYIKVAVASTATLGDTLKSTFYLATPAGVYDPNTANNTFVHKRKVASSYDPNEKEASPGGDGPRGFIPKNTPMTYTIHFQNTGTAPARNITILDTLESDLDVSSFHMLTASHNATVYQDGNVVKFRFNDIYLPDSTSNYFGSMGSVTYAVLPKRDLAPGTEIKNRAGIYFDYNAPIITNYTLNTINIPTIIQNVSKGELAAQVFPNPANTVLNIKMENNNDFSVQIMDMLGRAVVAQNTNNGVMAIPTQTLPSGMYLLNIRDTKGNELNTKVVVKH